MFCKGGEGGETALPLGPGENSEKRATFAGGGGVSTGGEKKKRSVRISCGEGCNWESLY